MYAGLMTLIAEIKKCEAAGADIAALALAYVCIDSCAYLAMPDGQVEQNRGDFVDWVSKYLIGHEDQPYKYVGLDVYAARCATLHTFGAEANLHRRDPAVRKFGYHDGGRHMIDPAGETNLVLIGLKSFTNDVILAVGSFIETCTTDEALRTRVVSRLPHLMATSPATAIRRGTA